MSHTLVQLLIVLNGMQRVSGVDIVQVQFFSCFYVPQGVQVFLNSQLLGRCQCEHPTRWMTCPPTSA